MQDKKIIKLTIFFSCLFLSFLSEGTTPSLKLPRIFGDNMVLQRNTSFSIWGQANPYQKVKLRIDDDTAYTYAGPGGKWEAFLPPHKAGGPYTLEVESDTVLFFNNVLFGEVWLASGQSNMEFRLMDITDGRYDDTMTNGDFSDIRYFHVERGLSSIPQDDLKNGHWQVCTSDSIKKFSAVAWFFIKKLYDELHVPVAIIESTWGGTPVEAWTSQAMLETLPFYRDDAFKLNTLSEKQWQRKFTEADSLESLKWSIVQSQKGFDNGLASLDYDDSEWETIQLPKSNLKNVVWVRKAFETSVKKSWAKQRKEYTLNIGQAYIFQNIALNGKKLEFSDVRNIKIPASEMNSGKNVLTVRATSPWSNLVHIGIKDAMYVITPDGEKINLEGDWKFNNATEPPIPEVTYFHQKPAYIFNAMINPLVGYSIKGVIWYQGESNADNSKEYYSLFTTMIQDWRTRWRQGNFPFLFVQLANYLFPKNEPAESKWAEVREAQRKSLVLPNTAMAVAIDIGDARNIHPFNKKEVGERLSLGALKLAYDYNNILYSGPQPASWRSEGDKVEISFEHIGAVLKTKEGTAVKGFALAGNDKKFYWAEAQIKGDRVIVSCENVPEPVVVRYAWADNPECNLYNSGMLPASPFQIELDETN